MDRPAPQDGEPASGLPGDAPPRPVPPGSVPPIVRGHATGSYGAVPPPGAGPRPTGGYRAVADHAPGLPPPHRPPTPRLGVATGRHSDRLAALKRPSDQAPVVAPARPSGRLAPPEPRPSGSYAQVLGTAGPPSGGGPPSTGKLRAVGALPSEGDEVDGFRVLKTIGRGSMGRVYRARDPMGRDVALKVILGEQADADGVARFKREGQAMAAIPRHKNVVAVHTAGEARGLPYLVLDFVEGESLLDVLKRGRLRVVDAVALAVKLASGVDHIHQAGVLHRDLKPANILVRKDDGEPVITDFGMAGQRDAERLTRTGDLLGTPLYMPPEQVLGMVRNVDRRSDVWALGVVLYEALAGAPPFSGRSLVEVSRAITSAEPAPIEGVDPSLMGIIRRALAKRREDRYPTAADLASDLMAWGTGSPPSAPPPPPPARRPTAMLVSLGGLAVVAVALAVVALARARREAAAAALPAAPSSAGAPAATATAAPVTTAGRLVALGPVYACIERGDALGALGLLRPEVEGQPSRRAKAAPDARLIEPTARAFVMSLLSRRPPPERVDGIAAALEVLLRVRELARAKGGEVAAGGEVADAVLALVRDQARRPNTKAGTTDAPLSATLELLPLLARSDLRPRDRMAAERALDEMSLRHTVTGSIPIDTYHRALIACVTLDLDLQRDHLIRMSQPSRELQDTAVGQYVALRIQHEADLVPDAVRHDARRRLGALLASDRAAAFGPVSTAHALYLSTLTNIRDDDRLAALERARRLDPRSPLFGFPLAATRHRRGDPAGAKALARETVALFLQDDWAGRPTVAHIVWEQCQSAFESCLQLGEVDLAREILGVLDEHLPNDSRLEGLHRLLEAQ